MFGLPRAFERLVEELQKLPGIGPRTAYRLAFYILNMSDEDARSISDAIVGLKEKVRHCTECYSLSESDLCPICSDSGRDRSLICVVEEPRDVYAIEKTAEYRGVYHVLGGTLSPVDGIGPERLRIKELVRRVKENDVKEVIIATNPTVNGEITATYLTRILKPIVPAVSQLASGIPFGGDLDFADEATISRALESRRLL